MKKIYTLVITIIGFISFAQNTATTVDTKELFPELFQMKLPIEIPKIQFVPEKELYIKKSKIKGDPYTDTFVLNFKDKSIFKGRVSSNYGGHENTVSINYGKMNFSNGDSYEGHFYEGNPIQGKYVYANGDSLEIQSGDRNGCCNFTGKSRNLYYSFKNGIELDIESYKSKVTYKTPDGTKIESYLNPDNSFDGYTEFYTKEGFFYKGELSKNRPILKWEIQNEKGAFFAIFNLDGITGYVPYKDQSNTTKWGKFYLEKLVQPITYLAPYTFCVKGDCQNGESTVFVAKNLETGFGFEMKGNFENGMPIGDFVANDEDVNRNKYTIIGPIKNYKFHGKCSKAYIDKKLAFVGEYQNGLPQNGNLTVDEKLIEVKGFSKGKYIGKQTFPRSEQRMYSRYYEGEFNSYGQIEGTGTVYITDNNHWGYEGCKVSATDWKDGYSSHCCFVRKNGEEDCQRVYFVNRSDFPDFSFEHPVSLKNLAVYQQQKEQARAAQEATNNKNQNEYQCGQCNGLGVIKIQCPMCHGAGYRKDMVTYDKYTGNTGGPAKCSHCGGTGQYTVMGCSKCDGKGFVKK
ncbi:MAG TPA: zinc finger-like domain-containing protein [Flavobacterium sp.]|nr:zinc finger-like domain-containing protein [Flavobacterium sp.]